MTALEQMAGQGNQGEQSEDAFTQVVRSMDGAEDNIRRMQASGNLFEVAKNGIAAVEHIVSSSMKDELKSKALTIIHLIQDNAKTFERLAAVDRVFETTQDPPSTISHTNWTKPREAVG